MRQPFEFQKVFFFKIQTLDFLALNLQTMNMTKRNTVFWSSEKLFLKQALSF